MRTIIFVKNINNSFDGIETPLLSDITGEIKPIGKIPTIVKENILDSGTIKYSGKKVSIKLLLNIWLLENIALPQEDNIIDYTVYYDSDGNILNISGIGHSIGEDGIYSKETLIPQINKYVIFILNHGDDIDITQDNYRDYVEFIGFIQMDTIDISAGKLSFTIIDINELVFNMTKKMTVIDNIIRISDNYSYIKIEDSYSKIVELISKATKINIQYDNSNDNIISNIFSGTQLETVVSEHQIPTQITNDYVAYNIESFVLSSNGWNIPVSIYDNLTPYTAVKCDIDNGMWEYYEDIYMYDGNFQMRFVYMPYTITLWVVNNKLIITEAFSIVVCYEEVDLVQNVDIITHETVIDNANINDYIGKTPQEILFEAGVIQENMTLRDRIEQSYSLSNTGNDVLTIEDNSVVVNSSNDNYAGNGYLYFFRNRVKLMKYDRYVFFIEKQKSLFELISQLNNLLLLIFRIDNNFVLKLYDITSVFSNAIEDNYVYANKIFNTTISNKTVNFENKCFDNIYIDEYNLFDSTKEYMANTLYSLLNNNQLGTLNFYAENDLLTLQLGKIYGFKLSEDDSIFAYIFISSITEINESISKYAGIIFNGDLDIWRNYVKELFNLG